MPKTKTTSPARSQSGITTPKRKTTRGSRSLCSPALSTGSGRLTSLIDQFRDQNIESFALSPWNGRSVLNDNTEIEEPQRKSWWKKLDENSQDVMEILEDNRLTVNNAIEELIDIEVLSQEKKNYTLDLPESSDNESIKSIVLPQRRLFSQKERTQPQKKYGHLIDNRDSLVKIHKTNTANIDKAVNVRTRELFQNAKRSKIIFPAALLNISHNKTAADKTRENVLADPKPQVRNIFGNRPANKRKNMFADFILSESESDDEIPEIQPKVFCFQKKLDHRQISSISKGRDASPASSVTTDIEMDFRMLLPSSTMVENQLEDNMLADSTPIKRARLSKLSEAKESEAGTLQTNTTSDKTKQSNKSVASKNKSKASPELKDKSLNSSRITRSMLKNGSKCDENVNSTVNQDAKGNKSRSKISSKDNELDESSSKSDTDKQSVTLNKSQKQNKSKTRNSPKAIETEIESEEIVLNAISNVTQVINKSTNKSLPNITSTNKSVYEKELTIKVHDNVDKTGPNDVKQNEKEDDENNFTLEYENDDNEVVEEAVVHNDLNENQKGNTEKHNTIVLEKESLETEINKSKNKSSLTNKSFQQKPAKIVEESVESQTEQYSADDNVDGNQEQETENVQNKYEDAKNSREDMSDGKVIEKNEVELSQDNEEDANESEDNENEVNVSQENEEKAANESKEVENEISEVEDEEEANESDENEANVSDVNEDEANESQEIEEEANKSQEIEEEVIKNQEVEAEVNESQEDEEVANESQEIDEEAHESQEVVEAHASDEENENGMDEDEEVPANESQVNEASANESQEVENDEQESLEVASDAESEEVEDDQQLADSGEVDKAIASDPEISDDNQADVMEVDDNEEQESDSESESEQNEHASHEVDDNEEQESDNHSEQNEHASHEIDDNEEQESDSESEQNEHASHEVDDNEEQKSDNESEQNEHASHEGQIEKQNEIKPSKEVEEPPNVTHDTTGRHRKDLNKSPEVILHHTTNTQDSFIDKGRNTSVRKTKSMIKNLNIKPSLAPSSFSDSTRNSSAEGSGWDSHRITRKTLRQTFGKDFTPRKSLRALVMEKSAKRQTEHLEMHSETVKFPLANSTEMPEDSNHHVEDIMESDHEVSRRTRQTTLEMCLQKIKEKNIEKNRMMEAAIRNSFKEPITSSLSLFKVPDKPAPRRPKPAQSKPKKQLKSTIPLDELPLELIEDMTYKPPKRYQPPNASWVTKRLYKFLENKLEANYDYKARVRAEKLIATIYNFTKGIRRHHVAPADAVDVLKHEFARLEVVRTHFEFYQFFHDFMPREVRIKVVPDIVNKIALPRHGVFSDILRHTHITDKHNNNSR